MGTHELWGIDPSSPILSPELLSDPKVQEKNGGLGLHMLAAIADGVYTIPLKKDCTHVSIQVPSKTAARQIIADGGVLLKKAWWSRITSADPRFRYLKEKVPVWTGGMF